MSDIDAIVEKVAAVIYAQCGSVEETYDDDLNELAPHDRIGWYRIARAAISAYEEATAKKAASIKAYHDGGYARGGIPYYDEATGKTTFDPR